MGGCRVLSVSYFVGFVLSTVVGQLLYEAVSTRKWNNALERSFYYVLGGVTMYLVFMKQSI